MTSPADQVSLSVLGTVVTVPRALAELCADVPRTTETPVAAVDTADQADGLAELTRLAVENSPLLCIHACVVAGPRGLVVVPGRSGLGKTTLAAALMRAAFDYLSDEALALDRATRWVLPFARALAISADVWQLLRLDSAGPPEGSERLVPPTTFGRVAEIGGRIRDIGLAKQGSGPLVLTRGSRGDAILLGRSFNHYREPEASFRALVPSSARRECGGRAIRTPTTWLPCWPTSWACLHRRTAGRGSGGQASAAT